MLETEPRPSTARLCPRRTWLCHIAGVSPSRRDLAHESRSVEGQLNLRLSHRWSQPCDAPCGCIAPVDNVLAMSSPTMTSRWQRSRRGSWGLWIVPFRCQCLVAVSRRSTFSRWMNRTLSSRDARASGSEWIAGHSSKPWSAAISLIGPMRSLCEICLRSSPSLWPGSCHAGLRRRTPVCGS